MPRIRVRTPDGERIVGTRNCSSLTIRVDTQRQRSSLQLRADAQLIGGNAVIEHWTWDFTELPIGSTIELISEPDAGPGARYDPPDTSLKPRVPKLPEAKPYEEAEMRAVEAELRAVEAELRAVAGSRKPRTTTTLYCSFCGRDQEEVKKLVAGPAVFICDECIHIASDIIAE